MKPVNLYPVDLPVNAESGEPNKALIGGAAAGLALAVVLAGFFGFAHVESIKSEATKQSGDATAARTETTSVKAKTASVGTPVIDSDKQLAETAEKTLVSAYTERVEFRRLVTELQAIKANTGGWYTDVRASAVGSIDSSSGDNTTLLIEGFMPTAELAASFNERVNSTRTMAGAVTVSVKSEFLTAKRTKKRTRYFKFTVRAKLVDTLKPYSSTTEKLDEGGGTVVADAADATPKLSLDPEPRAAAKPKAAPKPAAPTNPFALAAGAASAGGAK